jgi:hypothetical protein
MENTSPVTQNALSVALQPPEQALATVKLEALAVCREHLLALLRNPTAARFRRGSLPILSH